MERGTRDESGAHAREAFLARLAGGLAHEIKNPLSTMAINLTLLEEDWARRGEAEGEDPVARRSVKRLKTLSREVSRLEGILDDFLRFARGGQINRAPHDICQLVRDTLDFLEPELEAAGVRLHVDLPSQLPLVMLDPRALEQALVNLFRNAVQAMPDGGELIVQIRRQGSIAELSVTDTGVGMEPEELERCFDLYWSTKRDGTGLGLSTVARIIEEHQGRIDLVSEKGRGTSVTLVLPLVVELARRRDAVEAGEGAERPGDSAERSGDSAERPGDSAERPGDSAERSGDGAESS